MVIGQGLKDLVLSRCRSDLWIMEVEDGLTDFDQLRIFIPDSTFVLGKPGCFPVMLTAYSATKSL